MTVLDACKEAAIELSREEPSSLFSTDDPFAKELRLQANRTAVAIMKAHDWRRLTRLHSITGDGATIAWDLPDDYDRMVQSTEMHSATWETWRYTPARDTDQWLDVQTSLSTLDPGFWIVLEGKMQVYPPITSGEVGKFYYVSKNIADGKPTFTADDDEFLLDSRLLSLGVVWRWRASKRMEYAEDMANYEVALAEAIGRDKGSRVLYGGRRLRNWDARIAYPGRLGS
jgi:hypothetical protein